MIQNKNITQIKIKQVKLDKSHQTYINEIL